LEVLHQDERQTGVGGQVFQQFEEGVESAGGSADSNYRYRGALAFHGCVAIDVRHEMHALR
jgi:hypothetical protein